MFANIKICISYITLNLPIYVFIFRIIFLPRNSSVSRTYQSFSNLQYTISIRVHRLEFPCESQQYNPIDECCRFLWRTQNWLLVDFALGFFAIPCTQTYVFTLPHRTVCSLIIFGWMKFIYIYIMCVHAFGPFRRCSRAHKGRFADVCVVLMCVCVFAAFIGECARKWLFVWCVYICPSPPAVSRRRVDVRRRQGASAA